MTMIPVPRYRELGVKPVWEMIKEVPDLMSYFPDFQANEVPDRSFMWSVVSTLRPEACKELLEKPRKTRSLNSEENKNELIEIHPDFMDKLLRIPNLPKSSTIMIAFAWFSYRQRKSCILAKQSRPSKTERKNQKKNHANLGVLRREQKKEQKKQPERKRYLPSRKSSEDMNVDARNDQTVFGSSRRDSDASPSGKISKIDRDILY